MRHRKALGIAAAATAAAALWLRAHRASQQKRRRRAQEAAADRNASAVARPEKKKRKGKNYLNELLAIVVPSSSHPVVFRLVQIAALCLIRTALNDKLGHLQGAIFKTVFLKDSGNFVRLIVQNVVLHLGASALNSSITYVVDALSLKWRSMMNARLEKNYFSAMAYYKLAFVHKGIDNPEQIVANDLPKFCSVLSDMSFSVIKAVLDGTFFTWRLAQLTSPAWSSVGWTYVLGAVVVVRSLSPPFGKLHSLRQQLEGKLRQAFSHIDVHSEAIAAFGGHDREHSVIYDRFTEAVAHVQRLIKTQWRFGMVEDFVTKYMASTVAMIVILGPFFGGRTGDKNNRLRNAEVLANMRYVTSVIIYQLSAIGSFAVCLRKLMRLTGYSERIGGMFAALEEIQAKNKTAARTTIKDGQDIVFDKVQITTPTGNVLAEDVSFRIQQGTNFLITGPNGAGKSSIFRCLGALWDIEAGTITKPHSDGDGLCGDVFYLPQKPYTPIGNLREQLTYPLTADKSELPDERLRELLELVDLGYLMDKASADVNWEESLSLGETQRLAMARLFYHEPRFAILDECTSGVNSRMEERLYNLCRERGITCITISHRPALVRYHDLHFLLDGRGGYSIKPLSAGSSASADLDAPVDEHYSRRLIAQSQEPLPDLNFEPLPPPGARSSSTSNSRFLGVLRDLVPSFFDVSTKKLGMLVGVVAARVWLSDRMAHLNGHTVKYLLQDDLPGFKRLVLVSLVQCVMSSVLAPTLHYFTRDLALGWRKRMSKKLYDLYFRRKAFYRLGQHEQAIRDAEQRLTEDLDKMCTEIANVFPDVVKPVADLGWFTFKAVVLLGARNTFLLYLYMVGGLGFLRMITPDFGKLRKRRQALEGRFRQAHSRLRVYGESVAFFGGDAREGAIIHSHYEELMKHAALMIRKEYGYNIVSGFVIKELPAIVTWGLSFLYTARQAKKRKLWADRGGRLGHDLRFVASAVSHLFSAFGDLLDLYRRFADMSGLISRVAELKEELQALQEQHDMDEQALVPRDHIVLQDVDVVAPNGRCMAYHVSAAVKPGHNLLITGPGSCGKTSLLRIINGLWPVRGPGRVGKPGGSLATIKDVFVVPQRPYMPMFASLADLVTYPEKIDTSKPENCERLTKLLQVVNVFYLVERCGWDAVANDWGDVLSLGEQQRISMARCFFQQPRFAILDQCTDAVSWDVETALYDECAALGITILTLSQRPGLLVRVHKNELAFVDGNGAWQLSAIETSKTK